MAVIHLRRLGELAKPQREIEGRKAMIQCLASTLASHAPYHPTRRFGPSPLNRIGATSCLSLSTTTRRAISVSIITIGTFSLSTLSFSIAPVKSVVNTDFSELSNSDGVKALDLRVGTGPVPEDGDQVAIHYYGRLAAKQGWRFDSTYDHKDSSGEPVPFVFTLGSGKVISGIEAAVRSMKVGGVRRVIIPPSQGYQNTSQEPLPPNETKREAERNRWSCFIYFQGMKIQQAYSQILSIAPDVNHLIRG